jgi:RNA polymerase sigma-70 factor (ECF subfamily)
MQAVGDSHLTGNSVRDEAWHNALCKEHAERIAKILARRLGGDMHTARDLAQETMITAWLKREKVPDQALPWLYTTAGFHLRNYRRSVKNQPHVEYDPESMAQMNPAESADSIADAPDLELAGALDGLSTKDKEILELAFVDCLTGNEIAAMLGLKPATARKRLSRALLNAEPLLAHYKNSKEDSNDQPQA